MTTQELSGTRITWSEAEDIAKCDGTFSKSPGGMSDSEKLDWIIKEGVKLTLFQASAVWLETLLGEYSLPRVQPVVGQPPTPQPRVFGSRTGTLDPAKVQQYKNDMLSGNWRFNDPQGQIGGWVDSQGRYMIGEGHHRVQAAIETGDPRILNTLLENGRWTRVDSLPGTPGPLPPKAP